MTRRLYEVFAKLLTYPGADYHAYLHECAVLAPAELAHAIGDFVAAASSVPLKQLQEQFSATFELNPSCALDLGWHLFGEKYERGLLLTRMRRELRRHGIVETDQLPDHLSHALRLLGSMDRAEGEDFAGAVVLPAMSKLVPAAAQHEPFGKLLSVVGRYVRCDFDEPQTLLPVLAESI